MSIKYVRRIERELGVFYFKGLDSKTLITICAYPFEKQKTDDGKENW